MNGTICPLSEVNDPVFSAGMAGKGIAILPEEGKVYAPIAGTVSMIFPTHHAIGLTTRDLHEVILHIGIDTVKRNGEGFLIHVKEGEQVKPGDLLMEADLTALKKDGFDTTSMLVVNLESEVDIKVKKGDSVISGEDVLFTN